MTQDETVSLGAQIAELRYVLTPIRFRDSLPASPMTGRDLLNQKKQKSRRQPEEQPPIQSLQRSHQPPSLLQIQGLMAIRGHRSQRIEHRRLQIRQRPNKNVGSSPNGSLYPVQKGRQQSRCSHHHPEGSSRIAASNHTNVNQNRFLVDVPDAQHMHNH